MTGTKHIAVAALVLCTLTFIVPIGAEEPSSGIVTTKWLAENVAKVRIIDVRDRVADYWLEHIPGAVFLHPDAMRLADRGVPVKLTPPEALTIMLGEMGIDEQTTVVVYGLMSDYRAAYLVWALDYLGHRRALLLDGGFSKWKEEGRPVTQDYPNVRPLKYRLPSKLHHEVRATLDDVKKAVKEGGAVLLDTRDAELYRGEKGNWKRKGHIKGALHRFWEDDLNDDGTWKKREELSAAYQKLGIAPDKEIIAYCGQGQMSSHTYLTLRYVLGHKRVKNYDGSFSEWSNIDELPVELGMK